MYLPVPGAPAMAGNERYGGGVTTPGAKPTYSFMAFGFSSYADASYACWEIYEAWSKLMKSKNWFLYPGSTNFYGMPPGAIETDAQLWEMMADTIRKAGYEGKAGIQCDCASDTYYDREEKLYRGLFDKRAKTRDEMLELYTKAVGDYPFVILEDPFYEDDYESHALLRKAVDIQIVGDDLFTTMPSRVAQGIAMGAANTVLLKVNQVGTITEALEMIQLAYKSGFGVMPCESRGEGPSIADYCVGINAGSVRECGIGEIANRFLDIEAELGTSAKFIGAKGLKGRRFEG
jgi:enolase